MTNNIKEVTMYETEDGQVFESEEEARVGANKLAFIDWYEETGTLGDVYHEVEGDVLLEWLIENKDKVLGIYGDLK